MNKRIIPILILLSFGTLWCSKAEYKRYRVFPLKQEISSKTGKTGFIAIKVELPTGKHIYGNPKGPGIGKPTTVQVKSRDGISFQEARFLPAKKYQAPADKDFVWIYEYETMIFVPYTVSAEIQPGRYSILLSVDTLLCDERVCIPKYFNIKVDLLIGETDTGLAYDSDIMSIFQQSAPSVRITKDLNKVEKTEKKVTVSVADFEPRYISADSIGNVLQAILFGLLAGLILNVMPCVLPVVSLKLMSLVSLAGESRKKLITHGLLFSGGILVSFFVLAMLASFLGYNWGELFQKRLFLVVMIGIIFVFALSMLDVFTLNVPSIVGKKAAQQGTHEYLDSFFKGLLATLLATPCSGPFLGGTLAWALTQQPVIIFLIFINIGIGMSLPYMVVVLNPALIRFIPKPGNWTITFERIMAFLLLATVIYLVGILEPVSIMPMLWFLFIVSLACWQYGKYGSIINSKVKRIISLILFVIMILSGYYLTFSNVDQTGAVSMESISKPFSLANLYRNRDKGNISVVKFTADWCPNCKLVEKTSLSSDDIFEKMKSTGSVLLSADLTRKNQEAEALLKKLGSRSIPFLAVFPSGKDFIRPICLRDIYSEDDVMKALEMADNKIHKIDIDTININEIR